jgi:predicted thioesterase
MFRAVIKSNVRTKNEAGTTVAIPLCRKEKNAAMKHNRLVLLSLILVALVASACSLNRQLPEAADEEAMVVEVRSAIAAAVPGKTFALEVDVTEGGRVRLSGHVDSASDRDAIVSKVRQVNGVTSVDASGLHVEP